MLLTDINECDSSDLNDCHEWATCNNTDGNYTCSCNDGFTGDGYNCTGMENVLCIYRYTHLYSKCTCRQYLHVNDYWYTSLMILVVNITVTIIMVSF